MTPKKWTQAIIEEMDAEQLSETDIDQYVKDELSIRNISPLLFHAI